MEERMLTLCNTAQESIKDLLTKIGFPNDGEVVDGIVDMVNMLSDYHEEGQPLYPEVLIANNKSYLNTFINHRIKLAEKPFSKGDFSQCIKMCSPLAVDGWSIYILLLENRHIEYGVLTSEVTALSLDLYSQTMSNGVPDVNALYLRNVGNKTVEVRDVQNQILVSLNLKQGYASLDSIVRDLVGTILPKGTSHCVEKSNFLIKSIRQALNEGHGNLIAVSEYDPGIIKSVTDNFHGGVFLERDAVNLEEIANDCMKFHTEETSRKLSSYTRLMQSMLNFDGITLFANDGSIIGYHFIVNNDKVTDDNIEGGSRTRAYLALCKIDGLKACFMRSQDGKIKYNKNEQ